MSSRLDKIISDITGLSRRDARERIRRGAVTVDGTPVKAIDAHIDPDTAVLTLDGQSLQYSRFVYIMMYKPAGLVSATDDPRLPTVLTLLPETYKRRNLFPAGRLDRDSEGLLLLTDDGNAAHMMLSPMRHVEKTYFVRYTGTLAPDAAERFARGITIDGDELCLPAQLIPGENQTARVILTEGKFHQVKRMIAAVGGEVTYLLRERFGPLSLDSEMKAGDWRELYCSEVAEIDRICRITRATIQKSTK